MERAVELPEHGSFDSGRRTAEVIERLARCSTVLLAGLLRCAPRNGRLNDPAQIPDPVLVLYAHIGDDRAAAGLGYQQVLSLELPQRLANRCMAHTETLFERSDLDPLPGMERSRQDLGAELIRKFEEQLSQFELSQALGEEVTHLVPADEGFTVTTRQETKYHARTVIIASGKRSRPLNVPGEEALVGRGVS